MNVLKKLIGYDEDLSNTGNFLLFLFRLFTYILPLAIFIWCFVIENAMSNEVSVWTKIGCGGIFVLIIAFLFAIHFVKRAFNKNISKLSDKIIMSTDENKKLELINKKLKVEAWPAIFGNICLIIPFAMALCLINMIETQMISLRGVFFAVVVSMLIGLAINFLFQKEKRSVKDEKNQPTNNKEV